ncbi:MAG: hypothetical protein ACKVWV_03855 [Planctomycetota bacterium]
MSLLPLSFLAVDWSGAIAGVRRKLWLAEVRGGRIARLECGRDREELIRFLIALGHDEPRIVVGLDFAFSFPRWFVAEHAASSAPEMWSIVRREGERWLRVCPPPFFGRLGSTRPSIEPTRTLFRRTESAHLPVRGIGPKSVFQVNGAGSVGTGSLRGMPWLQVLRDAGFAIWPFDAPRLPLVVEIYPRYLTGRVAKSRARARKLFIEAFAPEDALPIRERAASSEDAFDAAVSALRMARCARSFESLSRGADADTLAEGRIWVPQTGAAWLAADA